MARRRPPDEEGSFDSLMDTLANVVGILVILLIMMQLGVADAVKRILRAGEAPLVEVSPEALAAAQKQKDELERTIAQLREQWKDLDANRPRDAAAIEDIARITEQLRAELAAAQAAETDADQLKQQLAERRKKADELNTKLDAMQQELAKLRAQMETTAVVKLPPAKVITLPNPRIAPEGAKPVTLIVKDGRITPGDEEALREVVDVAMKRLRLTPDEQGLIDCQKLTAAFETTKLGDRYWIVRARVISSRLYIVPERREAAGETTEQLAAASSGYMRLVRLTKQQNNYLKFVVWADSYDAYLEARRIADEHGVAAGWSAIDSAQEWRIWVPGKVECIGKPAPPPPPANQPPKPPPDPNAPPPKPPLPKEDID